MKFVLASAAAFLICISPGRAEEGEDAASAAAIDIAEQYLAAYSTFDVDEIEPFLADNAVFYDPTSSTQTADGGPFHFESKEAILKGLGDYAAQYKSFTLNYDLERRYESEGSIVFVAQLTWTVIGKDDQTFTGAAPIVTVVKIENGKVIGHTDYYDYKGNAVDYR